MKNKEKKVRKNLSALICVIVLFMMTIACDRNSISPTSDDLMVNPVSVHMKVGDSQIFTVTTRGEVNYDFTLEPENVLSAFDIRREAYGVRVTYVRHLDVDHVVLRFSWYCTSATCYTQSNIFLTN